MAAGSTQYVINAITNKAHVPTTLWGIRFGVREHQRREVQAPCLVLTGLHRANSLSSCDTYCSASCISSTSGATL